MEEGRSAFKILTGKHTEKRPLGRPRSRWEEDIRMDLEEIGSMRGVGLIRLRIGLLESPWECGIEPSGSISHGVSYTISWLYPRHITRFKLWCFELGLRDAALVRSPAGQDFSASILIWCQPSITRCLKQGIHVPIFSPTCGPTSEVGSDIGPWVGLLDCWRSNCTTRNI